MIEIPSILTQYLEHFPAEAAALGRLTELVTQCTVPQELIERTNYVGHVTASGFVLTPDETAVLLVYHRRLDMYLQPGGHLEPSDQSPLHGAQREVCEETGLEHMTHLPVFKDAAIPFDIDSHYIPPNPRRGEPEHWHHDFRYLFRCSHNIALTLASHEVADARWVSLRDLGNYPTLERVAMKLTHRAPHSEL